MSKSNFVILNGFDRSGSSAISQTLAKHPEIELIMQPFNSGFIRKGIYRAIEKGEQKKNADLFFSDLAENKLNHDLIHSHWHEKHSTTKEYIPGKIHLVKTTINHFAQRFMKEKFPEIDIWGIWRDPFEIFRSIQKNDFQNAWYADALEEVRPTIREEKILKEQFAGFLEQQLSKNQELAILIAVRSYFFFYYLDADKLVRYDAFRKNANSALSDFCKEYKLSEFDFSENSKEDLNITGKKFDPKNKNLLKGEIKEEIKPIFEPLIKLHQNKFF